MILNNIIITSMVGVRRRREIGNNNIIIYIYIISREGDVDKYSNVVTRR